MAHGRNYAQIPCKVSQNRSGAPEQGNQKQSGGEGTQIMTTVINHQIRKATSERMLGLIIAAIALMTAVPRLDAEDANQAAQKQAELLKRQKEIRARNKLYEEAKPAQHGTTATTNSPLFQTQPKKSAR
jgi:hypothetical protein